MGFNLEKDYLLKLYNTRVSRLKDYINKNEMKASVIGLSGGIDSALATFMLKDAIGSENIYVLMLPSAESIDTSLSDAKKLIETIKIPEGNCKIIEIAEIVNTILNKSKLNINNLNPMVKGNISARVRMIQLYAHANNLCYSGKRAFVEGTENESEYRTGYFTKYGDVGTDFEAMKGLYKTQVRAIAKLIGIPQSIIDKKPSAELIQGQTDEDEMGISYEELDNILYMIFEERNLMELTKFPSDKVKRVVALIEKSSHKRKDKEEDYLLSEAKQYIK